MRVVRALGLMLILSMTGLIAQDSLESKLTWSHTRGFAAEPFELTLGTDEPSGMIRYTTDGSSQAATNGLIYTAPIVIERTTVVRARAVDPAGEVTPVETHTFLFADQVVDQEPYPEGYIREIISVRQGPSRPHTFDWAMDPEVFEDVENNGDLASHLRDLPTLSVVMDLEDFNFIYANHAYRGVAYERAASVELIYPDQERYAGFEGFQIDCGIRMQGGGAVDQARKKSFRLLFKNDYGAGTLDYPLFESAVHFAGNAASRYEGVVLRAGGNTNWSKDDAWKHEPSTYLRDSLVRDSQIAISGIGSRSIFVHLTINGFYFGLYNIVERPDAKFMASYLGGAMEDYYSINHDGTVEGDPALWNEMLSPGNLVDLDDPARFQVVSGVIDVDAFCDYILLNWLVGMGDWPWNNFYGGVRNTPAGKIRFFSWDAEYAFWTIPGYLNSNPTAWVNPNFRTDNSLLPRLWRALAVNQAFRLKFADRVYRHCSEGGALTDARLAARFQRLAAEIENAIVAESARWGDSAWGREDNPHTRAEDWIPNRNAVLALIEGNAASFVEALRAEGLYPVIDPPLLPPSDAPVASGFVVTMENPNPEGTVYYTLDGTDPRLTGKDIAPTAIQYEPQHPPDITRATRVKARVLGAAPEESAVWSALTERLYLVSSVGFPLRVTELMYHPVTTEALEFVELKNVGPATLELTGCYFQGLDYRFAPGTTLDPYQVVVLIPNDDPGAFALEYPGVEVFDTYGGHLSNGGEEITICDSFDRVLTRVRYHDSTEPGWAAAADGVGYSLEIVDTLVAGREAADWRTSLQLGGSPGRVGFVESDTDHDGFSDEAEFHAGTDPEDPNSYLGLELERLDATTLRLRFRMVSGRSYTLQSSDGLTGPDDWHPLKEFPQEPAGNVLVTDAVISEQPQQQFYRLVVRKP